MKTLTINVPATSKKVNGKTFTTAAYAEAYTQDDAGQWTFMFLGKTEKCQEADVIATAKKSAEWVKIRAEHFPMYGF